MPDKLFTVDDSFGEELSVLFVEEGKQVPFEQLSMEEADRGIVMPKSMADQLVPQLKLAGIWGKVAPPACFDLGE